MFGILPYTFEIFFNYTFELILFILPFLFISFSNRVAEKHSVDSNIYNLCFYV